MFVVRRAGDRAGDRRLAVGEVAEVRTGAGWSEGLALLGRFLPRCCCRCRVVVKLLLVAPLVVRMP